MTWRNFQHPASDPLIMTLQKCMPQRDANIRIGPLANNKDNAMSLQIRRVVTGHAADGRAVVKIDDIAKNVISNRPGASSCVVWSTTGFPVNNNGDVDPSGDPSAA